MVKFRYEWFLFDYKDGVPDVMSKPFKTKAAAEKAREKYPPKVRAASVWASARFLSTAPSGNPNSVVPDKR
jgi:hypothetical protein